MRTLKEKTEAASYAEVMKNAFKLYERMIELSESGHQLFIRDREGRRRKLELIFWLQTAPGSAPVDTSLAELKSSLKARLNAASDSYPTSQATCSTLLSVVSNRRAPS